MNTQRVILNDDPLRIGNSSQTNKDLRRESAAIEAISAIPRAENEIVLSVNNDNMSKKAVTQAELLSERPVIPPETSLENEDILDMLMKNDQ